MSRLIPYLLIALAGCSSAPNKEKEIRDVRPTTLARGEKMVVESNPEYPFAVGAPTTVVIHGLPGHEAGFNIPARAVGPNRVIADINERVEDRLNHEHKVGDATVTVLQTFGDKVVVYRSDPRDRFHIDLFPHNLRHFALRISDHFSTGAVIEWLGMNVRPDRALLATGMENGVRVDHLQVHFDKNDILGKYDRPPLDGEITKTEARVGEPGGMNAEEFNQLDSNRDGIITLIELEGKEGDSGLAANAGIKLGDFITKVNGKPVTTVAGFETAWHETGDRVAVEVQRPDPSDTPLENHMQRTMAVTIDLPRAGAPTPLPPWVYWAIVLMLTTSLVALPIPLIAGLVVVWERKVSAYMQSRLGPNRVGPGGWLQWLADGLKLLMKEDIVPTETDPYLFKASPYLAFIGLFLTFVVMPFSHYLIVSDLNIGLLFLLSVTSLVVVSIIMGGWSSNSKWSLLGGMRSAAQIISYELPASVALLTIATLTGSLSTQKIVEAQGGAPWHWYLFHNPFTFAAFFIWFISALAEGNRTPFDLPEAESELVSGYNTEYSGFRFSLFPMVEWVNLFIIGAIGTALFLGGWRVPHTVMATIENHWWLDLVGFAIFMVKDIAIIFVIIWIRWTLPRFRVDQMMNLCWKYFIPASFICFVGVLAYTWLVPEILQKIVQVLMFAVFGLGFTFWFIGRVRYNSKHYSDLVLNQPLGRTNA